MLLKLGTPKPHHAPDGEIVELPGPAVTTMRISDVKKEDGSYVEGFIPGTDVLDVLRQFAVNKTGVMHFGGNEVVQSIITSWDSASADSPSWIEIEPEDRDPDNAAAIQAFFAQYWGATEGEPEDLEDTHYTEYSKVVYAPGEKP